MASRGSTFRTGGAGWWLTLALAIGVIAALLGLALRIAPLWVAIAAGLVAAVLPHQLDRRRRRGRSVGASKQPDSGETASAPAQRS
jgi:hypothetical protein